LISSTWESSSIKNVFWRRWGRRIRFFTYVTFSFTSDFAILSLAVLFFLLLWRRLVKQKWFMFPKSRISIGLFYLLCTKEIGNNDDMRHLEENTQDVVPKFYSPHNKIYDF
jgi:hypothetical protein